MQKRRVLKFKGKCTRLKALWTNGTRTEQRTVHFTQRTAAKPHYHVCVQTASGPPRLLRLGQTQSGCLVARVRSRLAQWYMPTEASVFLFRDSRQMRTSVLSQSLHFISPHLFHYSVCTLLLDRSKFFAAYNIIILFDNCTLPLPVGLFVVLT